MHFGVPLACSFSLVEAAVCRCIKKEVFLKFRNFHRKTTCVGVSFLKSCRSEGLYFYQNETSTDVFL